MRALAKSSAIETSSQFQGLNLLVADGPEKSWNYHQIAKIAILHHQLVLTWLLQYHGSDSNVVRQSLIYRSDKPITRKAEN